MARLFLYSVALMTFMCSSALADDTVRVEIGTVDWQRDYKAARQSAAESGKPLLMFFQEVPG